MLGFETVSETIRARLQALHRKVLLMDRLQHVSRVVGWSIVFIMSAILVDWLVRWPTMVRLALLVAGLLLAIRAVRSVIVRCWIQRPSLTSTALRLERVEPQLAGSLASALEFEGRSEPGSLEARVVDGTLIALRATRIERHLQWRRVAGWFITTLSLLACAVIWMRQDPGNAWVGLRRTLTPWTTDRWLPRVVIETAWDAPAVARGSRVPFRVRVVRGDEPDLRVRARCTTWMDSGGRDEREIELIRQPDGTFERPIPAEGSRMSIRAMAGDGETDPLDIRVVTAPSITSGSLEITPPGYATGSRPVIRSTWKGVAVPDPGSILKDSVLKMTVQLDAPALDPARSPMVRVSDVANQAISDVLVRATSPTTWEVSTSLHPGTWILVDPVDESGVRATEPLRLNPQVIEDAPPAVSVIEPDSDQIITTNARIPFQIMAKDDLQLDSIGWMVDRQQRSGEPAPQQLKAEQAEATGNQASLERILDVRSMLVKSGDTLLLRGTTRDRYRDAGGTRTLAMSEPRRLRIVDQDVLEQQVRQQTGNLRETLARLESTQREVMNEKDPTNRSRAQASVTERIRQASETTDALMERLRQNSVTDTPLADALREAGQSVSQARSRAEEAQEIARKAGKNDTSSDQEIQTRQKEVVEELAEAIDLLDRDDDAAAMQRRAERLAESIRELRKALRDAAQGTAGKPQEELGVQERQALQEQANRQRAAADEAAAMVEDLRERATQAQASDPAQSQSLQQAAEDGEKGQAARRLDEAAERTDRNQTVAADESLQRAAEAVERVRESLRQDRRARTEDLRRRLASLSETLRALIQAAESTLPRIDAAATRGGEEARAISEALLRISTNTAAAGEDARQGDRSLARIAAAIQRASERFDAAATALAGQTPEFAEARDGTSRGIEILRETQRKVAEEQARQQKASANREREQLASQFKQLAARVRASREVVATTLPAAGGRMDRKGAAIQREQGVVVGDVQKTMQAGPGASELLKEAEAFRATTDRISRDLALIRDALSRMEAGSAEVRRMDLVVDGLEGMVVALSDPEPGDEPFADAQGQEQAGGAGGAGGTEGAPKLPPITELRLIRQMQEQVNRQTRILDEARASGQTLETEINDLATMQDDIRRLGESWFERMRKQQAAPGSKDGSGVPVTPGFPWQEASVPATPTTGDAQPPKAPEASSKTLDELLGITPPAPPTDTADRRRERKLDSALQEKDLGDLATVAQESLALVDELVGDRRDTGLETQRAQAEALANIDALLDAATRFQQQQQSSRSSSGSSGSRRQTQRTGSEQQDGSEGQQQNGARQATQAGARQRRQPGDPMGDASEPPPPEDPIETDGVLEEGRIEWGALPQRIREIMSQARRDRVSALYQEATEAYYRRLAERREP